jgi:NAD(P)-dependent dehydrogenase (short-subunit alcohol dehydrogenase family)
MTTGAGLPLAGQVAIVTGGGKGLGRAFSLDLAARGAAVVVNNRRREVDDDGLGAADHVVAEIVAAGGRAVAHGGDVGDPLTGPDLVRTALDTWGRLDICVTSAAISGPQMFHSTTPENFADVMTTNVTGTALVASAAMNVMRQAGYGRIVLVASTAGLHGEPTVSAYAASKGAVIALGLTAAVEGERKGVLTNVVLPYATTQMTETGMDSRYADEMRADRVAPVVSALCDPGSTMNGQVVVAAGTGVRLARAVQHGTVQRSDDEPLTPDGLARLLAASEASPARAYGHAHEAFLDLAADLT